MAYGTGCLISKVLRFCAVGRKFSISRLKSFLNHLFNRFISIDPEDADIRMRFFIDPKDFISKSGAYEINT